MQVNAIRNATRLDGLLLVLHGAMAVEGIDAPEAAFVQACRSAVGTEAPIAATLDLHGNLTDELCNSCDVLVAYDTFPHVDMAERGAEALRLLHRMLSESVRPAHAHIKLPLITVPQCQATSEQPLLGIVDLVGQIERRPGIWTASVLPGYPYCDVSGLGFSVYVCGDQPWDSANELGAHVWSQRDRFTPKLVAPELALAEADRIDTRVALVDVADNVGGGSPGNGTVLLASLQDRNVDDNLMVIWDPKAIAALYQGQHLSSVTVGDESGQMGPPVVLSGSIRLCGHLVYNRSGSYMSGQRVDMGRCAVVQTVAGDIVITEHRVMPFDEDHLRCAGIDPGSYKVLVVKSATAWRGAVGSYVDRAIYVRTPGYCPSELETLHFNNRPVPTFPFEAGTSWTPAG
jgi:microcystin degradation protein MlrC